MDGLTLDQVQVFLTVVETGSFSAAARAMNRAQSAVTYAVQRLEEQCGMAMFDRDGYRPVLNEAGRALLPRARRIAEAVGALRMEARGIAGGLEAELSLVVDAMFPMAVLLEALKGFRAHFPTVQTRLYVETLSRSAQLVIDGSCALGIVVASATDTAVLTRRPLLGVELALVVAPSHPLAARTGPVPAAELRDHVQLVLTERSGPGAPDRGVHATQTWRIGDLGAKLAMLRAGLGFGSMPRHMVAADLAKGDLVRIVPEDWDGRAGGLSLPMCVVHRTRDALGPATRWMADHLVAVSRAADPPAES
ncbi:LysR family transcriptional regulator [Xanthobacter agilis]|uniref:DNA-binding transcriptional LysR family regulator n=1 Tax=Xanthobacter agilis TaxID=47492 RepID=A0ABU0LCV6_XANAG|nr:LysR family transcriptional regulator [Xanthobacter agilis]MDQ0504987.1 DNA-binding transcriptional LysR family regulator [Xanthobacter agilis]